MSVKVRKMMNKIIEFFLEADLIRVISCPCFPGIVFLGCKTFSFRTKKVPDKLGRVG